MKNINNEISNLDKEIQKELNKGKIRIFINQTINYIFKAVLVGILLSIIIAILSRVIPIYGVYIKSMWIILICILGGILYSIFKYPKSIYSALKIDSMGLNERVVTSIELKNNNSPIAVIQKKDTLKRLKNINLRKIPLTINKKYCELSLVFGLILLMTSFIPSPLKGKAQEIHNINVVKKEQIQKIKKVKKDIDKNENLKEWQKRDLNYRMSQLQKDIKKSNTKDEINKAFQRTDKKLEIVKRNYGNENLNKIAETFMKNKVTKELGQMLKDGDKKAFKQAIKNLPDELKKLNSQEKKKLEESYKKLAQEIKNDPKLAKAVLNFANGVASGQMGDVSSYLSETSDAISKMMESDEEFKNAVKSMTNALQESIKNQLVQAQGSQAQGSQVGSNGQSGNGGKKSSQSNGGAGGGTSAGAGCGHGCENFSEYDKVFTSNLIGGDGEKSNLKGKKSSDGKSQKIQTQKGLTLTGKMVPYNEVMGEYKSKAMETVNNSDIPEGMREIVKNYFSSLEN